MQVKTSSDKSVLRITRSEWNQIGREAGWIDKLKQAFEPESTYGGVENLYERDQSNTGTWQIDKQHHIHMVDADAKNASIESLEQAASTFKDSDPDVMLGFDKAVRYVKDHPDLKAAQGLKIVLYRILNLKDEKQRHLNKMILKKWYESSV